MTRSFNFGETAQGLSIPAFRFGVNGPGVLILGGVHGDEIEGVQLAHGLLKNFMVSFPFQLELTLVPAFNLDGVLAKTRVNAHGVDLNRNLPTKDWNPKAFNARYPPGPFAGSEPENQALIGFLKNNNPKFILSLHSWHPVLIVNGDCREEARVISQYNQYEIKEEIGYPTPGCLGTYAGIEGSQPTLTFEIERGSKASDILKMHIPGIIEALKVVEAKK